MLPYILSEVTKSKNKITWNIMPTSLMGLLSSVNDDYAGYRYFVKSGNKSDFGECEAERCSNLGMLSSVMTTLTVGPTTEAGKVSVVKTRFEGCALTAGWESKKAHSTNNRTVIPLGLHEQLGTLRIRAPTEKTCLHGNRSYLVRYLYRG